jgi:hypothetical protein
MGEVIAKWLEGKKELGFQLVSPSWHQDPANLREPEWMG